MRTKTIEFEDGSSDTAEALITHADAATAMLVLAHGAGAGMRHTFMEDVAQAFARHGISTFRYEFPYMRAGRSRTDPTAVAEATVSRAVDAASRHAGDLPILAGGKSFGGRMTSHAAASGTIPQARGLVFLGFPLHQPNKPSITRAAHLDRVEQPMLFHQGTRDTLADLTLIREVTDRLGSRATLHVIETADHSFRVLKKKSGMSDAEVVELIAKRTVMSLLRFGPSCHAK